MKHNRRSERVVFRQIERAQIEQRPSARGRFETTSEHKKKTVQIQERRCDWTIISIHSWLEKCTVGANALKESNGRYLEMYLKKITETERMRLQNSCAQSPKNPSESEQIEISLPGAAAPLWAKNSGWSCGLDGCWKIAKAAASWHSTREPRATETPVNSSSAIAGERAGPTSMCCEVGAVRVSGVCVCVRERASGVPRVEVSRGETCTSLRPLALWRPPTVGVRSSPGAAGGGNLMCKKQKKKIDSLEGSRKNYSIVGNAPRGSQPANERRATETQQEEEELKEKKKSEADGWIDRMRNGRGFAWMHMRKVAACLLLGRVFGSEKTADAAAARDLCTRR